MLRLMGSTALSGFRIQKLISTLAEKVKKIDSIHAEYIHFIDLAQALTDEETTILNSVLHYGEERQQTASLENPQLLVLV